MRTIFLLIGAASISYSADVNPAVLTAPGGRFVCGQLNSTARDQFMLDTQTGRLWQIMEKKGVTILVPVVYESMNADTYSEVPPAPESHDAVRSPQEKPAAPAPEKK